MRFFNWVRRIKIHFTETFKCSNRFLVHFKWFIRFIFIAKPISPIKFSRFNLMKHSLAFIFLYSIQQIKNIRIDLFSIHEGLNLRFDRLKRKLTFFHLVEMSNNFVRHAKNVFSLICVLKFLFKFVKWN